MNNKKILALIKERLNFVFELVDRKEDYEEYSIDAWSALSYISGLIAMMDGHGDEECSESFENDSETPSDKLVEIMKTFQKTNPEVSLVFENSVGTSNGTFGEALIYKNDNNDIVFDTDRRRN